MAGWTRLELATFCVTGRRSNQLSYHPENRERGRTVDLVKGVSSVLWKVCRRYFLEVLEGTFSVIFDLPAQLLQAAELALRPEEMEPQDRKFVAISERRGLQQMYFQERTAGLFYSRTQAIVRHAFHGQFLA